MSIELLPKHIKLRICSYNQGVCVFYTYTFVYHAARKKVNYYGTWSDIEYTYPAAPAALYFSCFPVKTNHNDSRTLNRNAIKHRFIETQNNRVYLFCAILRYNK